MVRTRKGHNLLVTNGRYASRWFNQAVDSTEAQNLHSATEDEQSSTTILRTMISSFVISWSIRTTAISFVFKFSIHFKSKSSITFHFPFTSIGKFYRILFAIHFTKVGLYKNMLDPTIFKIYIYFTIIPHPHSFYQKNTLLSPNIRTYYLINNQPSCLHSPQSTNRKLNAKPRSTLRRLSPTTPCRTCQPQQGELQGNRQRGTPGQHKSWPRTGLPQRSRHNNGGTTLENS